MIGVGVAFVLGLVVPWGFMRLLVPALAQGRTAENYRGRPVFLGLGIVWLVWAGCAIVAGVVGGMLGPGSALPIFTVAGPLALVAFALGMVDDALGTGADRGFRGHFRALGEGRMTTGMLKLLGVGTASLAVAFVVSEFAAWGSAGLTRGQPSASVVPGVVLAAAAIALSSNFVNLTDLRPGRAIKVYCAMALLAAMLLAVVFRSIAPAATDTRPIDGVATFLTVALMLLGPAVAVARYDLGELGMLGDAGANPMGAVAGMMMVLTLPLWGLALYAVALLVLNLASERVSFSAVIERSAPLRWLDGMGRSRENPPITDPGKSSPVRDRYAE